jgi:hypothetical protein
MEMTSVASWPQATDTIALRTERSVASSSVTACGFVQGRVSNRVETCPAIDTAVNIPEIFNKEAIINEMFNGAIQLHLSVVI